MILEVGEQGFGRHCTCFSYDDRKGLKINNPRMRAPFSLVSSRLTRRGYVICHTGRIWYSARQRGNVIAPRADAHHFTFTSIRAFFGAPSYCAFQWVLWWWTNAHSFCQNLLENGRLLNFCSFVVCVALICISLFFILVVPFITSTSPQLPDFLHSIRFFCVVFFLHYHFLIIMV